MSKTDMTVGGYTYSYSTIAKLAFKANTVMMAFLISRQLVANGGGLEIYSSDGSAQFDRIKYIFGYIEKVKAMDPARIGKARDRAIFNKDRKQALDFMFSIYEKLQSAIKSNTLIDGGGGAFYNGNIENLEQAQLDEMVTRDVQGGGNYNIGATSSMGGASDSAMDIESSSWSTGGSGGLQGTYFNSKLAEPSAVTKVDPSTVEYKSRPADRLEDRLFSRVDQLVGGRMASTLGRWSTPPTDDSPNPVKDRCLERGGTYIQKGRAFPIGGFSNGFAWTTNTGWNEASGINGIMGGRALLYYAHINPIKFGHAGSCKTKPSYVGDPAAIKPPMGTPGVNCCTIGMPKPTKD